MYLSQTYKLELTKRDLLLIKESLKIAAQMEDNALRHADDSYNPSYKVLLKEIEYILK